MMVEVTRWFKGIKVFDGKKENVIAHNGDIWGKEDTVGLIQKTHEHWKELRDGKTDELKALRESLKF